MQLYKNLSIAIILLLFVNLATAQNDSNQPKINKKGILIAGIEMGYGCQNIKQSKVEAAINFAFKATGKYYIYNTDILNSTAKALEANNETVTPYNIARNLPECEKIYFVNMARIENMIRIDINSILLSDTTKKVHGAGYGTVRYKKIKNNKMLYDPAILNAVMRAMAVAERDSNLFRLEDSTGILPLPTLVIGGLYYKDKAGSKDWEIYLTKEISSYDAVETIYSEIRDSKKYIVYDTQTRDSIYTLYKMLGTENFNPPSSQEIKLLENMEVDYYLTGALERTDEGAILDLYLGKISNGKIDIKKKATGILKEDSIEEYRDLLKKLTSDLFD